MPMFRDWRNQLSWGRICAAVALVVAVIGQFNGINIEHLKLWLAVAVGNYGASKLTEVLCSAFPKSGPSANAAGAASAAPDPSSSKGDA